MNINYEKTKISKLYKNLHVINFNVEDELTVNIIHVGPNWRDVESWLINNNCIIDFESDFVSRWKFLDIATKNRFVIDWS
jgi:hypothetical protein